MALRLILLCLHMMLFSTLGHQEHEISDVSRMSDDMELEQIARRNGNRREWQYEGIPIDLPRRKSFNPKASGSKYAYEAPDGNRLPQSPPFHPRGLLEGTNASKTLTTPPDRRFRRIYNADEVAIIEEYPFLAALLVNKQLWCGGAVIDSDKILTAAHCLQLQYNNRFFREYVKMLTVRVGSTNATAGGEVYRVTEIFFHPNYKPNTLEFNFAVLRLHKNMSFEKEDMPVAKIDYSVDKNVPTDSNITFLGWGSVLTSGGLGGQVLLQKLDLPVYDVADCQEVYGRELVTRTNFCAGYITLAKNVCNHDAGGPAIMDGRLVGILSFSSKRCDLPDQPAVFSSVGVIAPWLETLGEAKFRLS